jgi:hypothetical protein
MNPGMKMMLMDNIRKGEHYPRSEYGGERGRRMIGFENDDRRHDEMGRYATGNGYPEHDEHRYGMGGYPVENRRRRDRRGRYMLNDPNMMDDDYEDDHPHMGGSKYGIRDVYAEVYAPNAMNRPMGGAMWMGRKMFHPVDEHTARMWVQKMSGGEHFNMEQAEQLRKAHCPECEKAEFYVAMNMMYSDYCDPAKKMGVDRGDFYALMAKAFLMDDDAGPHKLQKYMETIPK